MPETNPLPSGRPSLADHVHAHGSHSIAHFQSCFEAGTDLSGSDVTDIVHFLCVLHGRHPGVVDHAAIKTADNDARSWFVDAMEAFAAERAFLTRLTVAAGPITGTGMQDQSEATVLAQRKALEMLAQSDRTGCAIGAAFALVLDWHSIRPLLEQIALKLGVEPRTPILPGREATSILSNQLSEVPGIARAINFGADQILAQHRGLWQLLDSRQKARIIA